MDSTLERFFYQAHVYRRKGFLQFLGPCVDELKEMRPLIKDLYLWTNYEDNLKVKAPEALGDEFEIYVGKVVVDASSPFCEGRSIPYTIYKCKVYAEDRLLTNCFLLVSHLYPQEYFESIGVSKKDGFYQEYIPRK